MAEGTEVGNPAGKKGFTPLLAGGLIAVAIATLVTLVLARRTWWGAVVGVTITGVVAFLGYWATLYVRLFLVV